MGKREKGKKKRKEKDRNILLGGFDVQGDIKLSYNIANIAEISNNTRPKTCCRPTAINDDV